MTIIFLVYGYALIQSLRSMQEEKNIFILIFCAWQATAAINSRLV